MRTSLALIALLVAAQAHGQTSGSVNMESIRSPFSASFTYSLTLQTESLNALGKLAPNPGQIVKVGMVDLIKSSVILAEIPGPKLLATTPAGTKTSVVSIRTTWVIKGGVGVLFDTVVIHVTPLAIDVPAGATLAVRYDMPAQSPGTTLSLAPGTFSWLVGVGAKASAIPVPVTPGPVATGPAPIGSGPSASVASSIADGVTLSGTSAWVATVTPDPTSVQFLVDGTSLATVNAPPYSTTLGVLPNGPHQLEVKATYSDKSSKSALLTVTVANPAPPIAAANPVGDCVAAAVGEFCSRLVTQLTDKDGKVWTLSGTNVLVDKVDIHAVYTDVNRLYMSPTGSGIVRIDSPSRGYACLIGTVWAGSGC